MHNHYSFLLDVKGQEISEGSCGAFNSTKNNNDSVVMILMMIKITAQADKKLIVWKVNLMNQICPTQKF